MKKVKFHFPVALIVLLLITALSCSQQDKKADVEADKAAIKEVLNQYAITVNSGNFDLWISLWVNNGVQMPPGFPTRTGIAQITEGMKPSFDQMIFDIKITSVEEAKVYGNLGLTRCNYTLAVTPKEGGDKIIVMPDGKALTLYEKQPDDTWKIAYDCFNSNTPPNVE
jgi:ketosteroid isomerase-like protein